MALGYLASSTALTLLRMLYRAPERRPREHYAWTPHCPKAQMALSHLLIFRDWQWEAALRKLDEALEINPNLATAHFYKSWVHVFFGRLKEAIAEQERGKELDPLALDWMYLGDLYRLDGRYDLAIAEATKLLAVNPGFPPGHIVLAGVYSDQGKHEKAIAEYDKAINVTATWKWYAGLGYAKAGHMDRLRNLLGELEQQPVNQWHAYWARLTQRSAWEQRRGVPLAGLRAAPRLDTLFQSGRRVQVVAGRSSVLGGVETHEPASPIGRAANRPQTE